MRGKTCRRAFRSAMMLLGALLFTALASAIGPAGRAGDVVSERDRQNTQYQDRLRTDATPIAWGEMTWPPPLQKMVLANREQRLQLIWEQEEREATPVSWGVMTWSERAHARLFNRPGKEGDVWRTFQRWGFVSLRFGKPWQMLGPGPQRDLPDTLRRWGDQSDLVVVAAARDHRSQLTADHASLFTEYDLEILELLRPDPSSMLQPGCGITVVQHGGAVRTESGDVFVVQDGAHPKLPRGMPCLLFLRRTGETDAYRPTPGAASFWTDGAIMVDLAHLAGPILSIDLEAVRHLFRP